MARKKSLRTFDNWDVADVLKEMGLETETVNNVKDKLDIITQTFEGLREGYEMLESNDVKLTLKIMESHWGSNWNKPSDFKVIKRNDEEGNTYVKIEWI